MPKNISWSRGFFRLWIVYGFIVAIITGVSIYDEKPIIGRQTLLYSILFEITLRPDGVPYVIKAPKGTSKQEALKYFKDVTRYSGNPIRLAHNNETDESLYLDNDGQWKPAQIIKDINENFRVISNDRQWFDDLVNSGVILTYKIESITLGFFKTTPKKIIKLKLSEYREYYQVLYDSRLWDKRKKNLKIGLFLLAIPLIIGLSIKWILKGFRRKEVG